MENISIRKVEKSEVAELQRVGIRTFLDAFGEMNDEADMNVYLDETFSLEHLRDELNTPGSQFFFLREKDTIIGYLKVNTRTPQDSSDQGKNLEIQRIYLLAGNQGKGFGKILLEKGLEIAKQEAVKTVWLGVWEKNYGAIRFYERYGFKAYDKHSFFLGQDEQTDLLMKLEL